MRITFFLLLILCTLTPVFGADIAVAGAESQPHSVVTEKTYLASRVGKLLVEENPAKTLELYNLVIARYVMKNDKLTTLEKEGIVYLADTGIAQRLNARVFLGNKAAVIFKEERNYGVGDNIPMLITKRDGTLQYVGSDGTPQSIPLYSETSFAEEGLSVISKEQFVEMLKSGTVFEVTERKFAICSLCRGTGLIASSGGRTLGEKKTCPQCESGKIWQITQWKIKW